MPERDDVTEWLREARAGDRGALDRVFDAAYSELKSIAHARLAALRGRVATLATTALVHEVYLKLVDPTQIELVDRAHFYSLAARAMRQILVDRARRRLAAKRGGGAGSAAIEAVELAATASSERVVAIHSALARLERLDDRLARVVDLRFFGGFSENEVAELLAVTERTVRRDWQKARALLQRELSAADAR